MADFHEIRYESFFNTKCCRARMAMVNLSSVTDIIYLRAKMNLYPYNFQISSLIWMKVDVELSTITAE